MKWISVKDKLPDRELFKNGTYDEESYPVLVIAVGNGIFNNNDVFVARYNYKEKEWVHNLTENFESLTNYVIYWQPLPELPEEGEGMMEKKGNERAYYEGFIEGRNSILKICTDQIKFASIPKYRLEINQPIDPLKIRFKGKRVDNGEWVEGFLIFYPDMDMHLIFTGECESTSMLNAKWESYTVIPESVELVMPEER